MSIRLDSVTVLALGVLGVAPALAAAPPPGMLHVRGTIQSLHGNIMTIQSATGPIRIQLPAKPTVASVLPSSRAQVKDGSFLGIASASGPNGTQRAVEVVVFPEAARGTGEGSYDWDLPANGTRHSKMTNGTVGHSKMTNGTVGHSMMTNGTADHSKMTNGAVKKSSSGALTLQYKNGTGMGSQTISLPPNIPFVTFGPGSVSQLTPGAHVFVIGHQLAGGVLAGDRVMVGKNGLVPPM